MNAIELFRELSMSVEDESTRNRLKWLLGIPVDCKYSIKDGGYAPVKAHEEDAGFDIFAPYDFTIPGQSTSHLIMTGLRVETPAGMKIELKSKSGLLAKHNLTTTGLIDEGYSGQIGVTLINNGWTAVLIEKGDKITQMSFGFNPKINMVEVDEIAGGDRGDGGFGSTGEKA